MSVKKPLKNLFPWRTSREAVSLVSAAQFLQALEIRMGA